MSPATSHRREYHTERIEVWRHYPTDPPTPSNVQDYLVLERPLLLAHAVHLSDDDIALLDHRGVGLSHFTGGDMRTGRSRGRIAREAEGLRTDVPSTGPLSRLRSVAPLDLAHNPPDLCLRRAAEQLQPRCPSP